MNLLNRLLNWITGNNELAKGVCQPEEQAKQIDRDVTQIKEEKITNEQQLSLLDENMKPEQKDTGSFEKQKVIQYENPSAGKLKPE